MSDLYRMYPDLVIVGKDGRFRTLSIDWNNTKKIANEINRLKEYENGNEN